MSETERDDIRTGGCLCGAVRYRAKIVQHDFNACSCDSCRKWGSGPYMAVHAEAVAWEAGEPARFRSSDWAERGRAAQMNAGAAVARGARVRGVE